ncbi:hypothetical protein IscW_ISCW023146 [Ixodes scapularis]|uniref:Uncharacterized protein n=1 Tax=Ixodes scapularis TaxID=6945 RepID=B7QGX9_IXOSC|nr:hypothetical protein IscW_ISCW023146 [Ixodes scapularis]|eukprot:XP_002414436.1 hypothetical protein IscW_ISCW023146 [Ixodes scapularis]
MEETSEQPTKKDAEAKKRRESHHKRKRSRTAQPSTWRAGEVTGASPAEEVPETFSSSVKKDERSFSTASDAGQRGSADHNDDPAAEPLVVTAAVTPESVSTGDNAAGADRARDSSTASPMSGFLSPTAPTPTDAEGLSTRGPYGGFATPDGVAGTFTPTTGLASPPSRPLAPASTVGKVVRGVIATRPSCPPACVGAVTAVCFAGLVVLLIRVLAYNASGKTESKTGNASVYSLQAPLFAPL